MVIEYLPFVRLASLKLMTIRPERSDARRNRLAILAAAEHLLDKADRDTTVTMDDIAAEAGLGKGTLFRRFGNQRSLFQALYDQKAQTFSDQIQSDEGPLGPSAAPGARVAAILTAIAHFKLDNLSLVRALETSSHAGTVLYESAWYEEVHELLADQLVAAGADDSSWLSHVLVGSVRADLLDFLAEADPTLRAKLGARYERLVAAVLPD